MTLLLGLLREGEGVAARVLENLDADPSKIRSQARDGAFSHYFTTFSSRPSEEAPLMASSSASSDLNCTATVVFVSLSLHCL